MKEKLNPIRYATPYFLYILSLFFITNIFGNYCNNAVSVLSFSAAVVIIYFTFIKLKESKTKAVTSKFQKAAISIAILASFVFESIVIQQMFSLATEENTGAFGRYVLSIIILGVAFICSFGNSYTALKMSNILFIIPIAVLIAVFCSFFVGTVDFKYVFSFNNDTTLNNILKGITAALLLFSDSYIINIMQKSEKCYYSKNASIGFAISAAVCAVFGILLEAMFGNTVITRLSFPAISAVGIIPGFDFEEIIMFAVSVFILYRFTCKLCVIKKLFVEMLYRIKNRNFSVCFVFLLCAVAVLWGTGLFLNSENLQSVELLCAVIYFIAFILIPILSALAGKNKM